MKKISGCICALTLGTLITGGIAPYATADDNIYVYKNGVIMHREKVTNVDRVVVPNTADAEVTIYNANNDILYTALRSDIDYIAFETEVPQADMLDIRFNSDGTATDISPMGMTVEKVGSTQTVYYSDTYKRYIANFDNPYAGTATGYYKVSYADNEDFIAKLKDGHTIETVFAVNYTGTINNSEARWFSCHQKGGTGFLICKAAYGKNDTNEISFVPNTSESGTSTWRYATSGVMPESGVFYHVVGVWDKENEVAHIYVNGELMNETSAPGDLVMVAESYRWFGIGADPGAKGGETSMPCDIVLARIYDDPLSSEQVTELWNQIRILQETSE